MTKEEFIDERTKIISKMLDNPKDGIYPTTICFAELDDLYDKLMNYTRGPSWAQIYRDAPVSQPKLGKREHEESPDCWCSPRLAGDFTDEGGTKLYIHNEEQ